MSLRRFELNFGYQFEHLTDEAVDKERSDEFKLAILDEVHRHVWGDTLTGIRKIAEEEFPKLCTRGTNHVNRETVVHFLRDLFRRAGSSISIFDPPISEACQATNEYPYWKKIRVYRCKIDGQPWLAVNACKQYEVEAGELGELIHYQLSSLSILLTASWEVDVARHFGHRDGAERPAINDQVFERMQRLAKQNGETEEKVFNDVIDDFITRQDNGSGKAKK